MPAFPETLESLGWDERAAASGEQRGRAMENTGVSDSWQDFSGRFAPPPEDAPEDPVVQQITRWLCADADLVDVGCGGGRLSVPLARYCKNVTALDPSPAMLTELRSHIHDRGIENINIVESTWEDWPERAPEQAPGVVLIAHLLYSVHPIGEFLAKAERVARHRVVVLLSTAQPIAYFHPLWEAAHGEKRIESPGANEFAALLRSWNIEFDTTRLEPSAARPFPDPEAAVRRAASRLFVPEGSANYRRLEDAVRQNLEPMDGGGYRFQWQAEIIPHLFSWAPRGE